MLTKSSVPQKSTYTPAEAAEILGVSVRLIYQMCKEDPPWKVIKLGQRCIRIHKETFDKWFNKSTMKYN